AGRQQKQQATERQAVETLDDPKLHLVVSPSVPLACGFYPASPRKMSKLQILGRRIIARVDRVLQEFVLVVGPELADIRIGFDHGIDETPVRTRYLADVDVADDIAELVELDGTADRIDVGAA